MQYRLTRAFLNLLSFPLIHIAIDAGIVLNARDPIAAVPMRFLFEQAALLSQPYVLMHHRYPTAFELTAFVGSNLILSIVVLIGWWVILSALILRIARLILEKLPLRLHHYVIGGVGLVLCLTLWSALQNSVPDQITIDLRQQETPFSSHFSFSQGGESQMRDPGYFETAMQTLSSLHPRYVRIDHIFDYYDVAHPLPDGSVSYQWEQLDRVVTAIRDSGAEPFISLSYMPTWLALGGDNYAPPTDFQVWEEMVYQTVEHLNGERGFGIRYWEVWNEPNLQAFWHGSLDQFLQLYGASSRGVRRADPSALVGGAGFSSENRWGDAFSLFYERSWAAALMNDARENALPLDFLSWHLYETDPQRFVDSAAAHQSWVQGIDPTPELLITEWNADAAYNPIYDDGRTNAFAAAVIGELSNTSISEAFYFEPSDGGIQFEGRWGLMDANGTPKPVLQVFEAIARLNGTQLSAQSSRTETGAIAVLNENHDVELVVWNQADSDRTIEVTITNGAQNRLQTVVVSAHDITTLTLHTADLYENLNPA
ncbi:MAG: hypothetical protein U0670_15360 [Anaerolineae bacterium]